MLRHRQIVPTPRPRADQEKVLSLFLQQVSWNAIAQQSGVPLATCRKWASQKGWTQLREQTKQGLENSAKPALVLEVCKTLAKESKALRERLSTVVSNQVSVLERNPARSVQALANTPDRQGQAAVLKTVVDAASEIHGWSQERSLGLNIIGLVSAAGDPDEPAIDVTPQAVGQLQSQSPPESNPS